MPVQTRKVKPDEEGMRLDRWFKAHFPDLAFGHLQKLLRTGQVRVDGGRAKTNTRLEPGMAVRVPPLTRSEKTRTTGTKHRVSGLPRERLRRWAMRNPTPRS